MDILLPSSTDIFLTGGKSHSSEIALARYMIQTIGSGDVYLDVGAHYGYFSLLASQLVGDKGSVFSIEASPVTYRVLSKNAKRAKNIEAFNFAVSDKAQEMIFFEFPNLYSEYNSLFVGQYEEEEWFQKYKPKEISIQAIKLDHFLLENKKVFPSFIKIDVEGAEYDVLKGMEHYLAQYRTIIAMEYLSLSRGNEMHQKAEQFLKKMKYQSYIIEPDGSLISIENISAYLQDKEIDSTNAIFK
jgi:FkbM family methyltransferase